MKTISSRFSAVKAAPAPAPSLPAAFAARLTELYAVSQQNDYVFGSPLGPFRHQGQTGHLPRFVFFGPHATDESWRLAFLAGFDRRDLRPGLAMLQLIESLSRQAESGHGLNLTFFPIVDVAPSGRGALARRLQDAHWSHSSAPEIDLLEKDARLRGYHGFIRIESTLDESDLVVVRVREPAGYLSSPDVELISSEETEPLAARFERLTPGTPVWDGPLTVAEDLPVQPFELTLQVPAAWPDAQYFAAVNSILTRFILRYRAFQAYGQYL